MFDSRNQPTPDFRLLLSWAGAIGVLWLLLLWKSIGVYSQDYYNHTQSHVVVTSDAHVFAAGEHNFSPRRALGFFSSVPPSDQLTPLVSALFFAALALFVRPKVRLAPWLNSSPIAYRLQLATLNISRAPPRLR